MDYSSNEGFGINVEIGTDLFIGYSERHKVQLNKPNNLKEHILRKNYLTSSFFILKSLIGWEAHFVNVIVVLNNLTGKHMPVMSGQAQAAGINHRERCSEHHRTQKIFVFHPGD